MRISDWSSDVCSSDLWLRPLMEGKIRSVFLMTEPRVASSDSTNIETSIVSDDDHYVINGHKWWSSGIGDPRCSVGVLRGRTDPDDPRHAQQSMIIRRLEKPQVTGLRMLHGYGYADKKRTSDGETES